MGTKSGKLYRLQLREGTQAQAMMYCSSTWYCFGEKCHVGDATELRDRFLVFGGTRLCEAGSCFTQDAEPADTSEWKDHSECPEFTVKGKVGLVVCLGIPVPQGRGGRPGHGGQGDVHEKILAAIEAGLGRKHIFRTYHPRANNDGNTCWTCSCGCRRIKTELAGTTRPWHLCGTGDKFWLGSMRFCRNESLSFP